MDRTVTLANLGDFVKERLALGGSIEITVTGNSMFPLFVNKRDMVVLSPVKKLKKRQICFYQTESGQYLLHRIVKISKEGVVFLGDNRMDLEPPLSTNRVYGVVTEYVRRGKRKKVNCFFQKCYAFIWCLSIKARPKLLKLLFELKSKGKK